MTTDGITLSAANPLDVESCGIFESPLQQYTMSFGDYVENVYFLSSIDLEGLYTYFVTTTSDEHHDSTSLWTVTISNHGHTVAEERGTGTSVQFSYPHGGISSRIGQLHPPFSLCDPNTVEACGSTDICVQGGCIDKGSPQFVLSWEGRAGAYTLLVVTPLNTTISTQHPQDWGSTGKFRAVSNPANPDHHMEHVYFTPTGLAGVYPYYVHANLASNEDETWTVTVYVDEEAVSTLSGRKSSEVFFYTYSDMALLPLVEYPMDPESCNPTAVECCTDAQCLSENEICGQYVCIQKGAPQFVLSFDEETSESDYTLLLL